MTLLSLRLVLVFVLLFAALALSCAAELNLAADGRTQYTIITDPQATEAEQYAAQELASFLEQVTGAPFPVRAAESAGPGPALVVGPGRAAAALAPDLRLDELEPDGIVIRSVGDNLILAGDRPRGTLYAVYTFLEDVVGCRWWTSRASTIPHRPELTVPPQDVRYVPILEYREPFWWDAFDPDFAVRNKYNGMHPPLDEKRGGKIGYAGRFVHTFIWMVPPSKYFADHPEWFSEIDGVRRGGDNERVQLCLTNEELTEYVTQKALEWIEQHPDGKIISISQNDWYGRCECAECLAVEEHEGSPMGPLLHFINKIAAVIAEKHPDIAVDTLAYQYTRKPPRHVKPLPNVIIRLCSIECDFFQPLTAETNADFADDIRGWAEICDRLYIWDYTTNFAHYIMPFPNLRVLDENIRFFVENGVKGIFEQGAYQSPGADMAELRAWVLAKLLWNPELDGETLIAEFIDGYFGPAGPYIAEYLQLLHEEAEKTDTFLTIWVRPSSAFLSLDLMTRAEELFNQAEEAVADDAELLNRVQLARLPIRYVWSMRWYDFQSQVRRSGIQWPGPTDFIENVRTFMEVARANNITMLSEGRRIDAFEERTIGLGRTSSPLPTGFEDLPEEQWIDLQDGFFNLAYEGVWAKLEQDPQASDNVAARMGGEHNEWAVQVRLDNVNPDPEAVYSVYASIRLEKTGNDGLAFSTGVYDIANKQGLAHITVQCADIAADGYETYKIGTMQLHDETYIWVAPPKNPENVEAVWVDRIWMVKE